MKILCVADETAPALYDYWTPQKTEDIDLIISAGDLDPSYLEFLVTVVNRPLLYVRGNHDGIYDSQPPLGCQDIDDTIVRFHGMRILGLGGSMRYHDGKDMYTEQEMEKRIHKLKRTLKMSNGFDMLVTHAPAAGYGDLPDLPHQGFQCFNALLEEYQPKYMLYGHVHKEYGDFVRCQKHACGAELINCWGWYKLEVDDSVFTQTPARSFQWYEKLQHWKQNR